ncbi:hypothetical protein Q9L58_002600 [Maublancomyces gigas]|uniref:Uncharacterized protein n=1 Tax=Discina gigas TaxID=1032678 RepID=A0ABR3GQZ6_9PEZI
MADYKRPRLHEACDTIINRLPYKLSPDDCHSLPGVRAGAAYLPECRRLDCDQAYPKRILLISDSLLHFDTTDPESVQKLYLEPSRLVGVKEGDWVSVPTLPAYLDSLFSCHRELRRPELGWLKWLWGKKPVDEVRYQRERALASYIVITTTYLLIYTFHKDARMYPDVESVAEPIKQVAAMLRKENRPDFLKKFVGVDPPRGDDPWEHGFESSDDEESDKDDELAMCGGAKVGKAEDQGV